MDTPRFITYACHYHDDILYPSQPGCGFQERSCVTAKLNGDYETVWSQASQKPGELTAVSADIDSPTISRELLSDGARMALACNGLPKINEPPNAQGESGVALNHRDSQNSFTSAPCYGRTAVVEQIQTKRVRRLVILRII
jgi:hypothetical protein